MTAEYIFALLMGIIIGAFITDIVCFQALRQRLRQMQDDLNLMAVALQEIAEDTGTKDRQRGNIS